MIFTKTPSKSLFFIAAFLLLIKAVVASGSALAGGGLVTEAPAEIVLVYSDGTVQTVIPEANTGNSQTDSLSNVETLKATVIDLGVEVLIMDQEFTVIKKVNAGQDVILGVMFNALGELEVPFNQLVGKKITVKFQSKGKLKLKETLQYTITSTDQGVVGLGKPYTIPAKAKTGKFVLKATMTIQDFNVKNNIASGRYSIIE